MQINGSNAQSLYVQQLPEQKVRQQPAITIDATSVLAEYTPSQIQKNAFQAKAQQDSTTGQQQERFIRTFAKREVSDENTAERKVPFSAAINQYQQISQVSPELTGSIIDEVV